MEQYIDDIKICAEKLSVVGYEVDDDEEQQSHKSNSGTETSSLFVATQKLQELSVSGPSGSSQGSLSQHTGGSGTSAVMPSSSSGCPPLGFPVSNMKPTTSYQCFPMWRPVTSPSAFPMPYQFSVPYTPMASPTPSQFANSGSRSTSGYGSAYNGMFSTRSGSGTTFPHA
ncbi:hypothetical protein RHGRI_025500 [Rhododendron griersonianum]|uniref:Uncharacterized protein n=1 Tax=Rhododendron griersonianum TaxID=479676 RepID=A0AAV6ITX6_9ERIC|nr:hypothetical protein RHGRI_025500 [Rhododendron griersonianum]